jgi:transposase, IS30 family
MSYLQLTPEQRYKLEALLASPTRIYQYEMAEILQVNASTISREIKRNKRPRAGYQAVKAQAMTQARKRINTTKITGELENQIISKLKQEWSPEQISGQLALEAGCQTISHESIYKYVYRVQKKGSSLYEKLRRKRKKRRKRLKTADKRGKIQNKTMINERPSIINDKQRIGDWEGDTIIGKDHKGAMLTLVERVTKTTLIFPLKSKSAKEVELKIQEVKKQTTIPFLSVTFDNGTEFTNHDIIAKNLETSVYFANPYHSWERGLNENTNGLIRQYIPKKTDFSLYSDEYVKTVQDKLNNRPRKKLGFLTPNQFWQNSQNCTSSLNSRFMPNNCS